MDPHHVASICLLHSHLRQGGVQPRLAARRRCGQQAAPCRRSLAVVCTRPRPSPCGPFCRQWSGNALNPPRTPPHGPVPPATPPPLPSRAAAEGPGRRRRCRRPHCRCCAQQSARRCRRPRPRRGPARRRCCWARCRRQRRWCARPAAAALPGPPGRAPLPLPPPGPAPPGYCCCPAPACAAAPGRALWCLSRAVGGRVVGWAGAAGRPLPPSSRAMAGLLWTRGSRRFGCIDRRACVQHAPQLVEAGVRRTQVDSAPESTTCLARRPSCMSCGPSCGCGGTRSRSSSIRLQRGGGAAKRPTRGGATVSNSAGWLLKPCPAPFSLLALTC